MVSVVFWEFGTVLVVLCPFLLFCRRMFLLCRYIPFYQPVRNGFIIPRLAYKAPIPKKALDRVSEWF